jgi:hypothetical protein
MRNILFSLPNFNTFTASHKPHKCPYFQKLSEIKCNIKREANLTKPNLNIISAPRRNFMVTKVREHRKSSGLYCALVSFRKTE